MEKWMLLPDYDRYAVSNKGRVKNVITGRILKPRPNQSGYLRVQLSDGKSVKDFYIHRLVAFMFIPNVFSEVYVNHKDENKANNCVDNLEWCDGSYNINYGTRNERDKEIKFNKFPMEYFENNPVRRGCFKTSCKKRGWNFNDFEEKFACWYEKPDKTRERLYTYKIREVK